MSESFFLESLDSVQPGDLKMGARVARELAVNMVVHPMTTTPNKDDLVSLFESSFITKNAETEGFSAKSYRDVMDAIGSLLASEKRSACVILTKQDSLVVAPMNNGQYRRLSFFCEFSRSAKTTKKQVFGV
jgi:hypothetical protein